MRIVEIDYSKKKIKVEIPLTKHTGKVRVKERISYTDFGIPVATRQKKFNKNMYIEWQIGYDIEKKSKDINLSTLLSKEFKANNKKTKVLYELSEYLYYFYKMNVFSNKQLEEIRNFIENLKDGDLIENKYKIWKSNPKQININSMRFLESEIKYPHLIYDFDNGFFIIAEITIKEKQKAIGIQPMLYLCIPITYLKDKNGNSLIGRTAYKNEKAIFEINDKNAFIVLETVKIFGMFSASHRHDILQILDLVTNNNC